MKVLVANREIEWPAGWPLPNAGQRIVIGERSWVVAGVEFHPPVVQNHVAGKAYLTEPLIVVEVVAPIGPVKEMEAQMEELRDADPSVVQGIGWGRNGRGKPRDRT